MANKNYSNVNPQGPDNKGGRDGLAEKGSGGKAGAPGFKEGPNPNVSIPKLPQQDGAED